jgi:CRP/FNR family transcriptional regulator
MYYLEPGSACALSMMCTARNEKSQKMARAVTSAGVLLVPSHLSEVWLGKYKSWHTFVIASYRQRFGELLQTLDSIAFKGLDERLVFYLRRHVKGSGKEVRLSHQQIADELNSCPGPMFVNLGFSYWANLVAISGGMAGTYLYRVVKEKLPH